MSREIKFRFFPVKSDIYPRGGVMRYSDNYTSVDLAESEVWKVMQFTGLHDRNGKPIYEGDVVKAYIDGKHSFQDGLLVQVEFLDGCFQFLNIYDSSDGYFPIEVLLDSSEVIGNIYEHRHLLKGDQP